MGGEYGAAKQRGRSPWIVEDLGAPGDGLTGVVGNNVGIAQHGKGTPQ